MHLHIGHSSYSRKLPKPIHDYMRRRFAALPEYLEDLRCFEFYGTVNGKTVKRFHIYSPIRSRQQNVRITNITDLDGNPNMILYEGYIDREGKAYVADRRSPLRIKKQ